MLKAFRDWMTDRDAFWTKERKKFSSNCVLWFRKSFDSKTCWPLFESSCPSLTKREELFSHDYEQKLLISFRINPLILNQDRRQREDHHAIIFMGIVIAFIICHSLRVFLDIHEIFTLKKSNLCQKTRPSVPSVPSWVFIIGNLSHVLLSLNANINAYIYGFMSSKFRLEIKKIFKDISRSCRSSSSNTNTLPQGNSTPV